MAEAVTAKINLVLTVSEAIPRITNALTEIVSALEKFTDRSLSAFEDAIHKYNSLNSKAIDSEISAKDLRYSLRNASRAAYLYVDRVVDVFWFGCDEERVTRVKEGIEKRDFDELIDYLSQLKWCLEICAESHEEAKEALEDVQSKAIRAAGDCKKKAQEAKTKKNVTRAVGGTASAGVFAAGGVASGFFTSGIGTAVGFGLTAAAGGAAAVTTHSIADSFQKAERTFNFLNHSFNDLESVASSMLNNVCELEMYLKSVSLSRENVERTMDTHRLRSSVIKALDHLSQSFCISHEKSSECREKMKGMYETVQKRFYN